MSVNDTDNNDHSQSDCKRCILLNEKQLLQKFSQINPQLQIHNYH